MLAKHTVTISQFTFSRMLASSRNRRDQSGCTGRPRKLTDTREVNDVEEWPAAREHLEKLQLTERAEERGANLMVDAIRKYLWEACRGGLRVRSPHSTVVTLGLFSVA